MKPLLVRLPALLFPALFLAGCVAVPYDNETVYYPAPTVSAHISSGYYYPYNHATPYPHHRPYYQPPAYVTPAPVIVPRRHFDYHRNVQPGIQNYPHPRHDGFRDGPRPDWQKRDGARQHWQRPYGNRGDMRDGGQRRGFHGR